MGEKERLLEAITHDHSLDALPLLRAAYACIVNRDPEDAAWRIADALGLVSQECGEGTIGIDQPTGRGYILDYKEPAQAPTP